MKPVATGNGPLDNVRSGDPFRVWVSGSGVLDQNFWRLVVVVFLKNFGDLSYRWIASGRNRFGRRKVGAIIDGFPK